VGTASFDRKFGAELLRELPAAPGVYLFKDAAGTVLYTGKAKNLRRRLQGYRSAKRRKAHRKMLRVLREASALEIRVQASEREALLLENELIRTLRPRLNVDGAYSFLYPAIGTAVRGHLTLLCFTTRVDAYEAFALRWHGCFRSRPRTLAAFEDLVALLGFLGHREPTARLGEVPRVRGSLLVAFRRIERLVPSLDSLLGGESRGALAELTARLLEKPDAREAAAEVGEQLRRLDAFFASDARKLREALRAAKRDGFVPQHERDALFLALRDRPVSAAGGSPVVLEESAPAH
jgi:predicted GIY-YIG superfamily endonuclease